MKANTSRGRRLAFDAAAETYDAVRPIIGPEVVAQLLERGELEPGSRVLEVGAGTGQLTGSLLDAGLDVFALEPGKKMASLLRSKLAGRGSLKVVASLFEDFDPGTGGEPFDMVVSANAFHWVDPVVSYTKAARFLTGEGSLALIWTFPVLANIDLQRRLNAEAFVDDLSGFANEPDRYLDGLHTKLAEGRNELAATGRFEAPWWAIQRESLSWTVDDYVRFLTSLANGAEQADRINERVTAVTGAGAALEIVNRIYVSVARRI